MCSVLSLFTDPRDVARLPIEARQGVKTEIECKRWELGAIRRGYAPYISLHTYTTRRVF